MSIACFITGIASLLGSNESATLDYPQTAGPEPKLGEVRDAGRRPTIKIAPARPWPAGKTPRRAPGTKLELVASGLSHPRTLLVLPNGDVLVAETDGPSAEMRPEEFKGAEGFFMKKILECVGEGPSANRITLLRGVGGPARVQPTPFLTGLNSPFGMALVGDSLYVANTDEILRFPYRAGDTKIDRASGTPVVALPAGPRNHHWTKDLVADLADPNRLYVSVGSNSDHQDPGDNPESAQKAEKAEGDRARIFEVDIRAKTLREFAKGLRNANGLAWEPKTRVLWAVVNERDKLGSDLVPDYLTSVSRGDDYGWPHCYYGRRDTRVVPNEVNCNAKKVPRYALGNHVAPLGLVFSEGSSLPAPFTNGAFVAQHGSWNRRPRSGYNVVFVPFRDGAPEKPTGSQLVLLDGFVVDDEAFGRPVGLAIDKTGALLVADDAGNSVWRVTADPAAR